MPCNPRYGFLTLLPQQLERVAQMGLVLTLVLGLLVYSMHYRGPPAIWFAEAPPAAGNGQGLEVQALVQAAQQVIELYERAAGVNVAANAADEVQSPVAAEAADGGAGAVAPAARVEPGSPEGKRTPRSESASESQPLTAGEAKSDADGDVAPRNGPRSPRSASAIRQAARAQARADVAGDVSVLGSDNAQVAAIEGQLDGQLAGYLPLIAGNVMQAAARNPSVFRQHWVRHACDLGADYHCTVQGYTAQIACILMVFAMISSVVYHLKMVWQLSTGPHSSLSCSRCLVAHGKASWSRSVSTS